MNIVRWQIEGRQCGACARTIEARLAREPGVRNAEVEYRAGTVRLLLGDAIVRPDRVIGLLQQAGYRVKPPATVGTLE